MKAHVVIPEGWVRVRPKVTQGNERQLLRWCMRWSKVAAGVPARCLLGDTLLIRRKAKKGGVK